MWYMQMKNTHTLHEVWKSFGEHMEIELILLLNSAQMKDDVNLHNKKNVTYSWLCNLTWINLVG